MYVDEGDLVYISQNVSNQEKEWLEKLGIKSLKDYFTVEFEPFNGTEIESQTIKSGNNISKPSNPYKEGYIFVGWYYLNEKSSGENVNYEEIEFDFDTPIMKDYILYAKYEGEAIMTACKSNQFFWEYKDYINNIIFTSDNTQIPQTFDNSWNVGADTYCSDIIAYFEEDSGKLTIFSEKTIYANPNTTNYFSNFGNLKTIDFTNFDTSKSMNMSAMFGYCTSLLELDLRSFNTQNVTSMYYMFRDCNNLVNLDLSNFNTTNVTNMERMFQRCSSLDVLNIQKFNMTNVTNFDAMLNGLKNSVLIKQMKI